MIGAPLLYFATPLAFNTPDGGDLRKILHRGQRMVNVHSGEKVLPKVATPWVGCTNVTDRQTTDGIVIITFVTFSHVRVIKQRIDAFWQRFFRCGLTKQIYEIKGTFRWYIRQPTGGQLPTGAQWNAFGRLMGHPMAAEKRRTRKLGFVVGASDTLSFINGYHRNQPIDRQAFHWEICQWFAGNRWELVSYQKIPSGMRPQTIIDSAMYTTFSIHSGLEICHLEDYSTVLSGT